MLKIRVHDAPIAVVDFSRLLQGHADSPDDAAEFLAVRSFRVHDLAAGRNLNDARDVDIPNVRVNFDFHELRAVRSGRIFFSFRRRFGFVNVNISVKLFRRIRSEIFTDCDGLFLICSFPSSISTSSIFAVVKGEAVSLFARSSSSV